jgi:inosine/guanosine/xanthosine phosphorylase family protein
MAIGNFEMMERAAAAVRARLGADFPATALVLGSGLGRFVETLEAVADMPYGDIPGFAASAVAGHAGTLAVGNIAGRKVAMLAGRAHPYEGHARETVAAPVRALKALGVQRLILTNASGGLKPAYPAGTLVAISDHTNFSCFNPLAGPTDPRIGPRFPDMSAAYDAGMRAGLHAAAKAAGVALKDGVYLYAFGPNFETPAEVRMFAGLGADVVGMSTVPECLVARHCGLKVAGVSVVTNPAAGLSKVPLTHAETLAAAEAAYDSFARLLSAFLAQ